MSQSQEPSRTAFHSLAKALAGGLERMLGKKGAEDGEPGADATAPEPQSGATPPQEGTDGHDDLHYVEFASLQAALGARNEGTSLERTTILQGAELAELRRNLGLLRPIGERLAEIEQERQAERALHASATADLRRALTEKEAEPARLRAELAALQAALEAAEAERKALRARSKDQLQRARKGALRDRQRAAEARQGLEEARAETAARAAEVRSLKREVARVLAQREATLQRLESLRGPLHKLVEASPKTTARGAKKRLVELMGLQAEPPAAGEAKAEEPRRRAARGATGSAKKKASPGGSR